MFSVMIFKIKRNMGLIIFTDFKDAEAEDKRKWKEVMTTALRVTMKRKKKNGRIKTR